MSPVPPSGATGASTTIGRLNDELLLAYLEANDAPCPVCGYNLRQLTTTTYPECGRQFTLEVGSASPYFGQYLAFLAPFIATAAIGVLFVTLLLFWGPPGSWGVLVIMLAGGVDLILLRHWYRKRVSFHRRTDEAKRRLIIWSWLIHLAVVSFGMFFTRP